MGFLIKLLGFFLIYNWQYKKRGPVKRKKIPFILR